MLVWTAGKSGSSKSSPFFRQLSRKRSNSELITLPSPLAPPLLHIFPLLPLTRSIDLTRLSTMGSARFGGARETGCAQGSWRGKGACRLLACLPAAPPCAGGDPTTRTQAAAAESWALPSFLPISLHPKLWKFQPPQGSHAIICMTKGV